MYLYIIEGASEKGEASGTAGKSTHVSDRSRTSSVNEGGIDTSSSLTSTASDSCMYPALVVFGL